MDSPYYLLGVAGKAWRRSSTGRLQRRKRGEEGIWLVFYDFGSKPNPWFLGNVRRLIGLARAQFFRLHRL
jgi:hypothetical protein